MVDPSFCDKNSLSNITILLVDDDPTVLSIVSTMLKSSKYRDSSIMEITVTTVRNSLEALSTLRVQRDNIDIVITDYHMPGMNGIELTRIIDQKFGKLPVFVMSSDIDEKIEQETISNGGLCFIAKPVKPKDLNTIWQYALKHKKKGKSISADESESGKNGDHRDDEDHNTSKDVVGEGKEHSSCSERKKWNRKSYWRSNSQETSNKDRNVNGDSSREDRKRRSTESYDEDDVDSKGSAPKKAKVVWTNSLHDLFLQAIRHIGLDKAVPKKILEFMSVPGLTRENIASHLQKYRIFLKKVAERGAMQSSLMSNRAMNSTFAYGHINSLQPYYNHVASYDSELGFGIGQSRLLMNNNNNNNICHNPCLYGQMNPIRSTSSLHNGGNFAFSNATTTKMPSFLPRNEERRGLLHMGMNMRRMDHTSQFHRIGSQYDTSNALGSNPRNYNGYAYAGIRINDRGDIIGLGQLQVNGNANSNSVGQSLACMNKNLNNNYNGYGSSSADHHLHQRFGHLSAQHSSSPSSSSSSSSSSPASMLSQLQPFLNNGVTASGQVDSVFPEFDKLSILSRQNQLVPEFPYDASNFQFNHNQMQGEMSSQNLKPGESPFGMDNLLQAIEDTNGWSMENTSQGGSNGETLNSAHADGGVAAAAASASTSASELYSPALHNNTNQEQGGGDLAELPYFNQDWGDDDFMDSLFNYGMQ